MSNFNIRVYGIYIENNRLLVTDEFRMGVRMTKLPGGGLQFGEGLAACLRREWREELDIAIEVGDIFFVNPFLQISAFNKEDEVICHYFWVKPLESMKVSFTTKPMDFESLKEDQQVFRWIPISELNENTFTFPIDKAIIPKLKAHFVGQRT